MHVPGRRRTDGLRAGSVPRRAWREQNQLRKKPSTSELIDWISALLRSGVSSEKMESHIPFLGSLLKNEQDTAAMKDFDERGGDMPSSWADLGPRFNQ